MEWIKLILICISSYIIATFIHELGHVLIGLYHGWKLYLLVVGPIGFKGKPDGGIKIYFEKNVKFWGGVGGTLPQIEDKKNINIWANILLAGPFASLILGLISLPLGIYFNKMFFMILGAMGIGMGLATALPFPIKTGIGGYIDGYRWKRLKNRSTNAAYMEEVALFRFSEFEQLNKNFQDFDPVHIKILKHSKDSVIQLHGFYAEYKYFRSIGDDRNMRFVEEEMNKLEREIPKFLFDAIKSELNELTTAANKMYKT